MRLSLLPLLAPALLQAQAPRLQEYSVDAGHSIVEFSIGFAFSRVKGRFTHSNGTILYDTVDPSQSSITIVIDARTIDTGWPHRDEHLRTSDFFDVEKYPTIVFQSERLTRTNDGWLAEGPVTMHGVTKRIAIPFRFLQPPTRSPESGWMMLNVEGAVRLARRDFGILGGATFNSWFDAARAATMSDTVAVSLEIEGWSTDAKSQRPPPVEAAIERIKVNGVQSQIDRLTAARKAPPTASAAGYVNGLDFVTRALIEMGRVQDAVSLSRALAELFPDVPRAHVVYGVALAISGDTRGAEREYAKAKEVFKPPVVDPNEKFPQVDDNWYYLDQLTRTLVEWGRASVALPVARMVADLYPGTARAHTRLGTALAAAGDVRGAAAAYTKALSIDPNETWALEYRRRLAR